MLLEDGVASGAMQWSTISLLFLFVFIMVAAFIVIPFDGLTLRFGKRIPVDFGSSRPDEVSVSDSAGSGVWWEDYGLTEREAEVAVLLAEGRNMQVLNAEGAVIEGLYAAGNNSGSFFGGLVQKMSCPGFGVGRAILTGRVAAKRALGVEY